MDIAGGAPLSPRERFSRSDGGKSTRSASIRDRESVASRRRGPVLWNIVIYITISSSRFTEVGPFEPAGLTSSRARRLSSPGNSRRAPVDIHAWFSRGHQSPYVSYDHAVTCFPALLSNGTPIGVWLYSPMFLQTVSTPRGAPGSPPARR